MHKALVAVSLILFGGCTAKAVMPLGSEDKNARPVQHSDFDKALRRNAALPAAEKSGLSWGAPTHRESCLHGSPTIYNTTNANNCQ